MAIRCNAAETLAPTSRSAAWLSARRRLGVVFSPSAVSVDGLLPWSGLLSLEEEAEGWETGDRDGEGWETWMADHLLGPLDTNVSGEGEEEGWTTSDGDGARWRIGLVEHLPGLLDPKVSGEGEREGWAMGDRDGDWRTSWDTLGKPADLPFFGPAKWEHPETGDGEGQGTGWAWEWVGG